MYDEFNEDDFLKKHKELIKRTIKNIKDLLEKLKMQSLKMTF